MALPHEELLALAVDLAGRSTASARGCLIADRAMMVLFEGQLIHLGE